jgi:hypothetical protein
MAPKHPAPYRLETSTSIGAKTGTKPCRYITGADAQEWTGQGMPDCVLLTKPFAPAQLVTAVSQLLTKGLPKIKLHCPIVLACSARDRAPDVGPCSEA